MEWKSVCLPCFSCPSSPSSLLPEELQPAPHLLANKENTKNRALWPQWSDIWTDHEVATLVRSKRLHANQDSHYHYGSRSWSLTTKQVMAIATKSSLHTSQTMCRIKRSICDNVSSGAKLDAFVHHLSKSFTGIHGKLWSEGHGQTHENFPIHLKLLTCRVSFSRWCTHSVES